MIIMLVIVCALLCFPLDAMCTQQQKYKQQNIQCTKIYSIHTEPTCQESLKILLFNKKNFQQQIQQASLAELIDHMKQMLQIAYSTVERIKFDANTDDYNCWHFKVPDVNVQKKIYKLVTNNMPPQSSRERLSYSKLQWLYVLNYTYDKLCILEQKGPQPLVVASAICWMKTLNHLFQDLLCCQLTDIMLSEASNIEAFTACAYQQLNNHIRYLDQLLALPLFDYHMSQETKNVLDRASLLLHTKGFIQYPLQRYDYIRRGSMHATIEIPAFPLEKNTALFCLLKVVKTLASYKKQCQLVVPQQQSTMLRHTDCCTLL